MSNEYESINKEALKTMLGFDAWYKGYNTDEPKFTRGTLVNFKLGDQMPLMPAYVLAVHLYKDKIKYDLKLTILTNEGWEETRIYNVEERWLSEINY